MSTLHLFGLMNPYNSKRIMQSMEDNGRLIRGVHTLCAHLKRSKHSSCLLDSLLFVFLFLHHSNRFVQFGVGRFSTIQMLTKMKNTEHQTMLQEMKMHNKFISRLRTYTRVTSHSHSCTFSIFFSVARLPLYLCMGVRNKSLCGYFAPIVYVSLFPSIFIPFFAIY